MVDLFDSIAEEFALVDFPGASGIIKGSKEFIYVFDVLFVRFREDDDVVDINDQVFYLKRERERMTSNPRWEVFWCVGEAKKHAIVLELTSVE